jgi:hypothetical protein
MNRKTLMPVAFAVAVALCVASVKWPQVQGVATILLLLVTLKYVLLTQENIELFRRQLERQEKVYLDVEMTCRDGQLYVCVANLGISNFLVSATHVRTQDIREFHFPEHEIVQSGKSAEIDLPSEVCAEQLLSVDLEVTLEYVGLDVRGRSEPKCFNVNMGLGNLPSGVKNGLGGIWSARCSRCHRNMGGLLAMSLRGLNSFDDAISRKKQLVEDLNHSCPHHESALLMTLEDAEGAL